MGRAPQEGHRAPSPGVIGSAETVLSRLDLFADLTPRELTALESHARRRHYRRGTVICQEGDPGTCLYVVEAGRVRVQLTSPANGKQLVIDVYGPGEYVGEMALLDGEPRSADVLALDDCRLLLLPREDFIRFLETHAAAAVKMLVVMSQRLRRATRQQEEASFLDVGARVASALLRLAEEQGSPLDDGIGGAAGVAVTTPITQSALAAMVGVTRESANKWTRYFVRAGWIRWEKRYVVVLQPEALRGRTR